jgi:ATP-binding cassette subfamily B (MDR/TAP) protein 1
LCCFSGGVVQAGAVVQQSLSQIRTVAAYNGEEAAAKEYDAKLDVPQKVGEQQGATAGLALGGMQFVMFCSYAVALYYGAVRVSQVRCFAFFSDNRGAAP